MNDDSKMLAFFIGVIFLMILCVAIRCDLKFGEIENKIWRLEQLYKIKLGETK